MSEKISQRILIVELIVFYIPPIILFFAVTFSDIYYATTTFPWSSFLEKYNLIKIPFEIFFCIGLLSIYFVSLRFLLEGTEGLASLESRWWFFSISSLLIVIVYVFVLLLPHSRENFDLEYIRSSFANLILGIPAFIPLAHVLLEKYLRKVTME
jgi:hypothetical protein